MADLKEIFSQIYDQHIDKIYRFIFLKVNSQELAEDLTSETFLRYWRFIQNPKENKIKKIENHQSFIYQIARNLVIDYYRQKGKIQIISPENINIVDPEQNLERKFDTWADLERVKRALKDLNEDYQNVIIWHYLNDLPIFQVAEMLNKTEGATRVLLFRALSALRDKLSAN